MDCYDMSSINILKQNRAIILKGLKDLSPEQLCLIPPGYRNNILWNFGHILAVQQFLHYKLSGIEPDVSDKMMDLFKKGTSPEDWSSTPDIKEVKELFLELPEKLSEDYQAKKFMEFQSYVTATGVVLQDIQQSLTFNNFHEGIHLGVIMCLKKIVL
ncbi:MAG: DinB family protein [Acidobacteriota bacterium]